MVYIIYYTQSSAVFPLPPGGVGVAHGCILIDSNAARAGDLLYGPADQAAVALIDCPGPARHQNEGYQEQAVHSTYNTEPGTSSTDGSRLCNL